MRHRRLVPMSALGAVIAVMSLAPVSIVGQTPAAPKGTDPKTTAAKTTVPPKTKTRIPPRTAWGDPDLQGVWSFATLTPLERPSQLGGKEFLTETEAAAVEEAGAQARIDRDRPPREGTGSNTGTYNQFWWETGTKVVSTKRSSLIVDPPDGRVPPLTPAAQKREKDLAALRQEHPADGPEDRSGGDRCIVGFNSGPPFVPGAYNQNVQLLQGPRYVVILNEMVHSARIVPVDGRPHAAPQMRQWKGDSRGRWEGDTLVVDTTNFYGRTAFQSSGPNMHLIERFTRVDDDTLLYKFTVEDPTTWTRPWSAEIPLPKSDGRIYEYACHEANYAMTGILAGARADEKKAAAQAATKGAR